MKILKTSTAVRNAITELMKPTTRRRVAVVAFVGARAQAFIPQPKGVEIICWPNPGATNPLELRRLIKMGAQVRFADKLHMKVYWAAGRGAVITSANLSTNAPGAGNLKEFGVLLPPNAINIDEIIASTKSYPCNTANMQTLEIAHRKINAGQLRQSAPSKKVGYLEWFSLPTRPEWKIGWWDRYGEAASESKEVARAYYDKRQPHNHLDCGGNDYKKYDWVLSFRLGDKAASDPEWLFAEYVVKVNRKDKTALNADYPYQAVQILTAKHYPAPPFALTKMFRSAFRKVCKRVSAGRIKKLRSVIPSAAFLKMLAAELQ